MSSNLVSCSGLENVTQAMRMAAKMKTVIMIFCFGDRVKVQQRFELEKFILEIFSGERSFRIIPFEVHESPVTITAVKFMLKCSDQTLFIRLCFGTFIRLNMFRHSPYFFEYKKGVCPI